MTTNYKRGDLVYCNIDGDIGIILFVKNNWGKVYWAKEKKIGDADFETFNTSYVKLTKLTE